MSGSTTKKVLLERFDREPMRGFVNPQSCFAESGVELLSPDGSLATIPYAQLKTVCFVRDLQGPPLSAERHEFLTRPKAAGLWVELTFRDGDRLQGMLPNNLLLIEPFGYSLTPPEASGNTQRVFVPRAAVRELKVLGVVGAPRRGAHPTKPTPETQIKLFSED